MTTKHVEPDVDAWREQQGRQRGWARNRKIGAFAVAAAIGAAAIALFVGTRVSREATTPANEPTAVSPVTPTTMEVATGFVQAFGAFDTDRAIAYLADEPDLSGFGLEATQELRSLFRLLEAIGYEQSVDPCEETSSSTSGTVVRCPFVFHSLRSDEIGKGPYGGSEFVVTVRDGKVVEAALVWYLAEFSPEMWGPFGAWMARTHPDDVEIMYDDTHQNWELSEESIRLWRRHSLEYVEVLGS